LELVQPKKGLEGGEGALKRVRRELDGLVKERGGSSEKRLKTS
jgi:hypothetical protein